MVYFYVEAESECLRFIFLNQNKLRAEKYMHLQYAVRNDWNVKPHSLRQIVVFPSSFINSPRYLHKYTQDAFTYGSNYGRPDLFITFTCNPVGRRILLNCCLDKKQRIDSTLLLEFSELKCDCL